MAKELQTLDDDDYYKMQQTLARFNGGASMNLEAMDGFFAALICCPTNVQPWQYLPELWGGALTNAEVFMSPMEWYRFLDLVTRHWETIATALRSGQIYLPLMLEDSNGIAHGNDWAAGFLHGINLVQDECLDLMCDELRGGPMLPILALAYEHHPDPTLRPYNEEISFSRREQLLAGLAAGMSAIYQHFSKDVEMTVHLEECMPVSIQIH